MFTVKLDVDASKVTRSNDRKIALATGTCVRVNTAAQNVTAPTRPLAMQQTTLQYRKYTVTSNNSTAVAPKHRHHSTGAPHLAIATSLDVCISACNQTMAVQSIRRSLSHDDEEYSAMLIE
jgi:hypothetical protein